MPSFHEQCSYVAIEMMMHGLPVIGSTTTGLKEMIEDGETGLHIQTVEYDDRIEIDTTLLAEKILFLLQNPDERLRMGQNARKRYEEKYAMPVFRKNMSDFYHSLFAQPKQRRKHVVLLSSHVFNDYVLSNYKKLQQAVEDDMDLFLLIESGENRFTIPENIRFFPFSIDTLNDLNYKPLAETIVPGSNHFQLFQFYKANPYYDYYWNIEYDVYFNGDWQIFFDSYKSVESDFFSSHLARYAQAPDWMWWDSLQLKTIDIQKEQYIKSFNPIYRISNRAMKFLDEFLSDGNVGHHEVLLPTVLNCAGFQIRDWGGAGEFVLPGFDNASYLTNPDVHYLYYNGSTMRFRPEFTREEIECQSADNKLYHPVKK